VLAARAGGTGSAEQAVETVRIEGNGTLIRRQRIAGPLQLEQQVSK
jgi:hypothetical protein